MAGDGPKVCSLARMQNLGAEQLACSWARRLWAEQGDQIAAGQQGAQISAGLSCAAHTSAVNALQHSRGHCTGRHAGRPGGGVPQDAAKAAPQSARVHVYDAVLAAPADVVAALSAEHPGMHSQQPLATNLAETSALVHALVCMRNLHPSAHAWAVPAAQRASVVNTDAAGTPAARTAGVAGTAQVGGAQDELQHVALQACAKAAQDAVLALM
jgi:hypothetical protein